MPILQQGHNYIQENQAMQQSTQAALDAAWPQMQAYKQQRPGATWEQAFQAVTGKPYTLGRDITIANGRPQQVNEVSGLDKIAKWAPIVMGAAMTAGVAAPYLAGGTAAAPALAGGSTVAANLGTASALAPMIAPTVAGGVTAGTVAATTPVVTHAASNWLGPLLKTAVPVAGQVINGVMTNNANSDAAKIQAQSTAEALAFEKQSYADLVKRLEPYMATGISANDRASRILGLRNG